LLIRLAQAVMPQTFIWEVTGLYISQNSSCPYLGFHRFHQCLQENTRILPQIRPWSPPSTSFPISFSLHHPIFQCCFILNTDNTLKLQVNKSGHSVSFQSSSHHHNISVCQHDHGLALILSSCKGENSFINWLDMPGIFYHAVYNCRAGSGFYFQEFFPMS
jgi:hypothetical protein